jgi:hypothetical protein
MTRQADFKRRVRARMAKTGESYATARSQLLAEQPVPPNALHVSNGDATDLPGTGIASRIVYWRDVLHEGPVPAVGPDELRRIRASVVGDDFTERDRILDANRDGEYVLWFEADLYDQLQIIQILSRLAELGVPAGRITLICIGEHAGIARFGGLGELTAEHTGLRLTGTGARVLAGEVDHVARNGVDRWIGGVHLHGYHVPWRWNDGTERLEVSHPAPPVSSLD